MVAGRWRHVRAWVCPFYDKWVSMLARCYSDKVKENNQTYKGCTVCEEWLTFSNFKAWMEQQDWKGKHLDKDLLFEGNKVYSPKTCVFVDQKVNNFLLESGTIRGKYPIGVSLSSSGKFVSRIRISGKQEYLGSFNTPEEAHLAWKKFKNKIANELAKEQTDPRVAEALVNRYHLEEIK